MARAPVKVIYRTRIADTSTVEDTDTIQRLHIATLRGCNIPDLDTGCWWIVEALGAGQPWKPVAFAGMHPSRLFRKGVYLIRAGVLAAHRGRGLHNRLIRARLAKAREQGSTVAVTDTTDNPQSANNLIRHGFRLFTPKAPWGGSNTIYFRKEL